jgi:hypothetical protein
VRSHSPPLAYFCSPGLSFLIHLTPLAYLGILRSIPSSPQPQPQPEKLSIDIPLEHLATCLRANSSSGSTIATLRLTPKPTPAFAPSSTQSQSLRPTFPLIPISAPSTEHPFSRTPNHTWVLDFTQNGKKGVIMAQSHMRVIECVVGGQQAGLGTGADGIGMGGMMFGGGSWVDLLVRSFRTRLTRCSSPVLSLPFQLSPNSKLRIPPGWYTAEYVRRRRFRSPADLTEPPL